MKKHGFTIFEVLMSFTIMFVIAAATIPLLFKKNKVTTDVQKPYDVFACDCTGGGQCTFEAKDPERNEFFTVQILGGGAGGGTYRGGGAGEAKTVYYPGLKDKYRIELGRGGSSNNNGGQTTIYKIDRQTGQEEILEYARGGITGAEDTTGSSNSDDNAGASSTFSENGCGKGGNAGGSGTMGEVIIRW